MEISASAPASALLFQVLAAVKLEIFKLNSGKCSLLLLVDSRLTEVITSTGAEITMVVPNLDNLTDASNFAAPQKLARLCSVLIIDSTSKLQELLAHTTEEEPEEDEDTSKKDWPQASFPGCPYNCYHIFVAHSNGSIDEDQVFRFAQTTRRVRHAYFVVYDGESVGIFTRSPNGENLYTIAKLKPEHDAPAFSLKILRPNFQGVPMIVNVCAKCGDGLEMFQRTNVWFFFFEAIVYELSLSINTTLQFEKLAAPQRDGPDEDGDWDAWKSPLLDGSAAIAGFQHYSIPALKVLHYTRPVVSTYALFITAKPKRVYGSDKLSSLLSPLSLKVWIGSCLSVVALYVAIELTLHVHRFSEFQKLIQMYVPTASIPNLSTAEKSVFKKMLPRHVHYSALVELVKPWIGQGGISMTFERNVANDSVAKFLLGIWLLILNVLGSAYQSELTSCVVSPEYTRPPATFRELAESKFTPFAIIWADNLANDFASLKNNYSRKLLETTREFEYFAKDCYISIFQGDNACIGLYGPMSNIGFVYLYDVNGRRLFIESKESLFHESVVYAVSPYFVAALEEFNLIIRTLDSTGIIRHWESNGQRMHQRRGKKIALESMKTMKVFAGKAIDAEDSIIPLLGRIMIWGLGPAGPIFLIEIVPKLVRKLTAFLERCCWSQLETSNGYLN